MASPVRWSLAHPLWALGSHRGIAAVTDGAGGGGGRRHEGKDPYFT